MFRRTLAPERVSVCPCPGRYAWARFFAAAVPLLQGVRLAAIGTGLVKNENAVRAVSREGDRKELLRGPLFYTAVMVVTTAVFWRTSPSAGCSSVVKPLEQFGLLHGSFLHALLVSSSCQHTCSLCV